MSVVEQQVNAKVSIAQTEERVGLSDKTCWRRIKRPEEVGVIRERGSLVDRRSGLRVTVFVTVRTSQHTEAWLEKFARGVAALQEVRELYPTSGDVDDLSARCW
jgi:Lrp/AsnC family transcriptional regulator